MCLLQDITAFNKFRHFSFFKKNQLKYLNSCKSHSMLTSQNFLSHFHLHFTMKMILQKQGNASARAFPQKLCKKNLENTSSYCLTH